MEKVGRNDPCPCGSGKKFKKCCEAQMSKRFQASRIEDAGQATRAADLSNLFQSRLSSSSDSNPQKP